MTESKFIGALSSGVTVVLLFISSHARGADARATYIVPAKPGVLEAESRPMPSPPAIEVGANGRRVLRFALPEDLVGQSYPALVLYEERVDGGSIQFRGTLTLADCVDSARSLTCRIDYLPAYADTISAISVERFLHRKYADAPAELERGLALFRRFKLDPEGVILVLR